MKLINAILLSLTFIYFDNINAQVPQSIPFQAAARNASGNLISNQSVSLRFTIHSSASNGIIVYRETQNVITNEFGLFVVNIGQGTPVTGAFTTINWGGGPKFIQTELDAAGGTSFVDMGTQQIMSVPYALWAGKSDDLPSGTANGNTMRWNGTSWVIDSILSNFGTNVGIGNTSPNSSALLDISSTNKGFLMPRMTTTQRNSISSPTVGLQIFNVDDQCIDIYDGVNWIKSCGSKLTSIVTDPGHPTANSWIQKANVGAALRIEAVGFSIGNKGYVGTGVGVVNDLWEYDPSSNGWTQKANFPGIGGARFEAIGFSILNKGYVGTGYNGTSFYKDFWEYDPTTNNWTQKSDFPGSARYEAVGFSIGDKGYVGFGAVTNGSFVDFYEFNPLSNSWTQKANMNNGTEVNKSSACFSIGNKGYVGTGGENSFNNLFFEYDPISNTWTQKASFGGIARCNAVGFSIGNKGYIGTGENSGFFNNDFWEYNPSSNSWIQKANVGGLTRASAIGFSIRNKGYIGTGFSNDFWEYMDDNLTTNFSTNIISSGNVTVSDGAWTISNGTIYNSNSGNVGIGTITPASKFDVEGNVSIGNNFSGSSTAPVNGVIIEGRVGIGTTTPLSKLDVKGSITIGDAYSGTNAAPANGAIIEGNVGIGISSPITTLQIGGAGEYGLQKGDATPNAGYLRFGDNSGWKFHIGRLRESIGGAVNTTVAGVLMTIQDNGKVGIGTSTPVQQLEIAGSNSSAATSGSGADGIVRFQPAGSTATLDIGVTGSPVHAWIQSRDKANYALNYPLSLNPNGGNVGIGTTTPASNIDIVENKNGETGIHIKNTNTGSNSSETIYFENEDGLSAGITTRDVLNSTSGAMFMFNNRPSGHIRLNTNGVTRIYIANNGDIGIGTTAPTQKLHVVGNICATGSIGVCSDNRYKKSIVPLKNCLEKVNQINGVSYFWKKEEFPENNFSDGKQIGVIAQDLEKIIPELVITDANGYKTVDYSKLTPVLIEAVKELKAENDLLKSDIAKIKTQIGMDTKAER